MMLIGLSQRVDEVLAYKERRDCLDQQWHLLLTTLELLAVPIPNSLPDPAASLKIYDLHGFILTGGNDLSHLPGASRPAPERDRTEAAILDYAQERRLPVFGVCRGFQMMNKYLGGTLHPVKGHVSKRHQASSISDRTVFSLYSEVNSFHDWGLLPDDLSGELQPAMLADDGTVEAAIHKDLPWVGIMWHPEREDPFSSKDLELINGVLRG